MGVFSRRVYAVVATLTWKRSLVVEQAHWVLHRTRWKPRRHNVRNLRMAQAREFDAVFDNRRGQARPVWVEHTYYEYEELEWRKFRLFSATGDSAAGDSPADVHWPEYALRPDQRISERRASYHAKFRVGGSADEYVAQLDEATWRALKPGLACRLTLSSRGDEVKHVTPALR
jgi:hypothetical protein